MKAFLGSTSYERQDEAILLYLPDGSGHCMRARISSENFSKCDKEVVLSRVLASRESDAATLIETIRDPDNPEKLCLLSWENGDARLYQSILWRKKTLLPPAPTLNFASAVSLADGLDPSGQPAELVDDICRIISRFITLSNEQIFLIATFILSTWFADCFEMAPYLWIVGPFGSAKTKLLRLLQCMCRRGVVVGDIHGGSLYQLIDLWKPSLLIDDLELWASKGNADLLRILRTGSTQGIPTIRNGRPFDVFGPKVISSRQPVNDVALLSRGVTVSMLPTDAATEPLHEETLRELTGNFQRKLLNFRLKNYFAVKNFIFPVNGLEGMTPRMKQIVRAFAAPLLGDSKTTDALLAILEDQDDNTRFSRSHEPEWLVTELLFALCHRKPSAPSTVFVGELADQLNAKAENGGDALRLSARKIGSILTSLGLRTMRLGSSGRGVELRHHVKRQIHLVARQLGIDRRDITSGNAVEAGNGGYACSLCEQIGVTGGLRFRDFTLYSRRKLNSPSRTPIFADGEDLQQLD